MNLEGIEDGVGGRGCMNERGVLGGSMLGITFFHASTNVASAAWAAGRSVEKDRALAVKMGRAKRPDARRNILGGVWGWSLGSRKVGDREREYREGVFHSLSSVLFLVAVLCCEVKNGTESEDLSFGLIRVWAYFLASGD